MNADSLTRAARDMGLNHRTVTRRVLASAPAGLVVRARAGGRLLIRNRPAFFAWWYGFGFGRKALEAFREWAKANGLERLAAEKEPKADNFHMLSETLAKFISEHAQKHERKGRGETDDNDG